MKDTLDTLLLIIAIVVSAISLTIFNKNLKQETILEIHKIETTIEQNTEALKQLLKSDSINYYYRSKEIYFDKKLNEIGKKALQEGVFDEF